MGSTPASAIASATPPTSATLAPTAQATSPTYSQDNIALLLSHHEVSHELWAAQNSEQRLLLLTKEGRLAVAQLEHLRENLGSFLLGETSAPAVSPSASNRSL